MGESSRDKLNSLRSSLKRLAGPKNPAGLSVGQFGTGPSYCEAGRDNCGNYPFCRSECVNGSLQPIPNNNTPDPNDCVQDNTNWLGGPGNFYPCSEVGIGEPGCPIACQRNEDGSFPNETLECACGKTVPDFYRNCCCNVCCCCPENENDPFAYDCEKEPPASCRRWRDTTNDEPEGGHQWVQDCTGFLNSLERQYGYRFETYTLGTLPRTTTAGHAANRKTQSYMKNFIEVCNEQEGGQCPYDKRNGPLAGELYRKLAACLEYRKTEHAVSNSCVHPFGSQSMWRGWSEGTVTNPCRRKWKEACTNIVGACCVELSNGDKRCYSGKTWKDCKNLDGDWFGEGSTCQDSPCGEDPYYDYYPPEYEYDPEYDPGYYDPDRTDGSTKAARNAPVKRPTKVTGPFQGKMYDKCNPKTWRSMAQPDIDEEGNPIPVKFDARPALCRRGCKNHPKLKGYDCSRFTKAEKDKSKSAASFLIARLRNRK